MTESSHTGPERSKSTLAKLERMARALSHREPDRVPISDFYWGGFVERWREELDLPPDASPYHHYDLDWIVTVPNMDPHIRSFETIRENSSEVVIKTGFETTLRKKFDFPMPEQMGWDTDTIEKLEDFEFDDPCNPRRYFEAGDNQIAGVGDGFARNSPAWVDTVKSLRPDFPVYGSVIECSECLTRLVGQENTLLWMGLHPDRMGRAINRIGEFYLECTRAALRAAEGLLDGFVIWGDMAYGKGLFFSPAYWREYFKPWVKAMAGLCREKGLPVIYHGCGNVKEVFADFVEMGIDAYNPLESKAGMDCVEMRRQYGHEIALCGGSDIRVWARGDQSEIRAEVLGKLNAAKGGGFIFQSDHSVPSDVPGKVYDNIVNLVREYGTYPLDLEEHDREI